MENKLIRIGTRGSALALYQAYKAKSVIESHFPDIKTEIVKIETKGDKILDVALSKIGDKGLFTKELEVALLNDEVDMAIHSLKDLPTFFPEGLKFGAVLQRAEVRDALVSKNGKKLHEFGPEDTIATSSLRRKAQLLAFNPELNIVDIRGNINTRLRKMDEGYCDAMIMAAVGLQRLEMSDRITQILDTEIMVPAVSQGAIGIETRENDSFTDEIMAGINHEETWTIVDAERAFLRSMEGGCQIPIGCYTDINNGAVKFTGIVADLDGATTIKISSEGSLEELGAMANEVSEKMKASGAMEILEKIRREIDPIA